MTITPSGLTRLKWKLMVFAVSDFARARGGRRKLRPHSRQSRRPALRLRPHAAGPRALPDDGPPLAQLRLQLEDYRKAGLFVRGARHRFHPKGRGDHEAVRQSSRADQHEVTDPAITFRVIFKIR